MPIWPAALRQARISAGLTQRELADRVGVVREEIARWEAGGRVPRVDTAVALAQALDTTVEAIWAPDLNEKRGRAAATADPVTTPGKPPDAARAD